MCPILTIHVIVFNAPPPGPSSQDSLELLSFGLDVIDGACTDESEAKHEALGIGSQQPKYDKYGQDLDPCELEHLNHLRSASQGEKGSIQVN